MSTTTFKGPVYSKNGFYFATTNAGNRPMTFTATSYVTTAAASGSYSPLTITKAMNGGLDYVQRAKATVRQVAGTVIFASCKPSTAGTGVLVYFMGNTGTGQLFGGRAATVDVEMYGYMA